MAPAASRRPHRSIHSHCRLCRPCFLLASSPYLLPFSFSFSLTTCYLAHLTPLFSRPTLISVFVPPPSLRSSAPFLLVLSILLPRRFSLGYSLIFVEMLFTKRTLEESEEDFFFFFFRKMKRTGGFWMEMFDPDKRSLIVSCTFLRFVFDGTNTFRDAGHISDRDRNSFMGT